MKKSDFEKKKAKEALRARELERELGMHYVFMGVPKKIPTGNVLVHNNVKHRVNTRSGTRGFRCWFQEPSDKLEPCGCGYAGLPHYRVKRDRS
jgi:hypothetical protein